MKIVINTCYGGYGLSHRAIMLWSKLANVPIFPYVNLEGDFEEPPKRVPLSEDNSHLSISYFTRPLNSPNEDIEGIWFSDAHIKRNDPFLVQVVEKLGEEANGHAANLEVVDIPQGTKYFIHEYDGAESIRTMESIPWETAT